MTRKKILVVDDSVVALMNAKMILRSSDRYEVIEAKDGDEGVAMAAAERPDLIVLDVVMPKMDGFTACRELRRLEETKEIPIVMMTTRGEAENVEKGFESGCNDYVTKPIDAMELMQKVESLLG